MKQILVIVPFPMSDENLQSRKAQLAAVELSPNLNFTFRPVKAAPRNYISQADMVMADIGILEAGLSAEEEGFDAVCVDTMSDSGVAALRSILRIPVVGPGRVAMLEAMMLGSRFSIVTMWQKWRHLYEKTISDLGISHALASVRSIDVAPDNQALLGGREDDTFPLLEAAARQAIEEDRAEVIILGSTTMHQAHAHLVAALDVPVINPGPLTYKTVESLVSRNEMIKSMLAAANKFEH